VRPILDRASLTPARLLQSSNRLGCSAAARLECPLRLGSRIVQRALLLGAPAGLDACN
jgi:hypothetical protein